MNEEWSELPRALAALIEQRVRATTTDSEQESESDVVALCDALLQTLCSAQLVPAAALLHRVLLFGAEHVRDVRCAGRTLDALLAARRALGVRRFRLCDDDAPEQADALFRLLERLLTRLHEPPALPATATALGARRKRARAVVALVQRFDADDNNNDDDDASTSDDADEPPANADAEPVSVERERALELLRFFATLCDLDRADNAPRPALAAILLVPPSAAAAGDPSAMTRHEKRHLTRVERLASLLVGCFGHLAYVADGDELVSSSARVVVHVRQLLHALAALVVAADADLLKLFNNALLSAYNMLPTAHARTLLVEALRHRAHKLLWLDFVLTGNFISSGVPRQHKPSVLAPPTRAKFDTVYRFLNYARGRCDDVVSSLRSLDTFVLLTTHVALELLATVADERAAGVPSTVLVAADAAAATAPVEVASPAAAASDATQRLWRADIRKDAAKNADPDEPIADDLTLFRIELLEDALYQLSCAARLLPAPPPVVVAPEPARPKRKTKGNR